MCIAINRGSRGGDRVGRWRWHESRAVRSERRKEVATLRKVGVGMCLARAWARTYTAAGRCGLDEGRAGRAGKCGRGSGLASGMGNEAQLWGERVCGLRLRKVNGCALELERARVGKG